MPDPMSPEWWVDRLYKQIAAEQDQINRLEDYYCGHHPLPWLPQQAQAEFRRNLKMPRSNYMGRVVDAQVERMRVEGFRIGADTEADAETWEIWQRNNLDADSSAGLLEASVCRRS